MIFNKNASCLQKEIKNKFNFFIMKTLIIIIAIISANINIFAQNVAINTDGSLPDNSAALDIKTSNKGMLLPRIALNSTANAAPVSSPANSLLVYNTQTINDVTPGYYYWDSASSKWVKLSTGTGGSTSGHYVGEYYAGGVVFYVDHTGDHGLVVTINDLQPSAGVEWCDNTTLQIGAGSFYEGAANTTTIMAHNGGATNTAAEYCVACSDGGYNDWYLPAHQQLTRIYNEAFVVSKGCIAAGGTKLTITQSSPYGRYWSSTEIAAQYSYYLTFRDGRYSNMGGKTYKSRVRAIRDF